MSRPWTTRTRTTRIRRTRKRRKRKKSNDLPSLFLPHSESHSTKAIRMLTLQKDHTRTPYYLLPPSDAVGKRLQFRLSPGRPLPPLLTNLQSGCHHSAFLDLRRAACP